MATVSSTERRDLARAWEFLSPSDEEVRFAVTRIAARLPKRRRRFGHRRSPAVVFGVIVLAAAIAYAAQSGVPWIGHTFGRSVQPSPAATGSSLLVAHPTGVAAEPLPSARLPAKPASADSVPHAGLSNGDSRPLRRGRPSASPVRRDATGGKEGGNGEPAVSILAETEQPSQSTQQPLLDASWGLVDQALSAHDDARAEALLQVLARSAPGTRTRAAARLGIAQLHAGHGDCETARRIAFSVAREPGVPLATARRAQHVIEACFAR